MTDVSDKTVKYAALTIMLAIGIGYMVFLAMTWRQLQDDRVVRNQKIDEMLDQMVKRETDSTEAAGD